MFDDIKPGDKVALYYHFGHNSYLREATVTSVTKTQFAIDSNVSKFWKRNGLKVGGENSHWRDFVEPLTDEARQRIAQSEAKQRDQIRRRAAFQVITNDALRNLDTATLEKIASLIQPAQPPDPDPAAVAEHQVIHFDLPDDWRIASNDE